MGSSFSAVVVSAGRSSRFRKSGATQLKQLIEWEGKPLFIHTLLAISGLGLSEIALVIHPDDKAEIQNHLRQHCPDLQMKVVTGGTRRQDSVRLGLEALQSCDRVLIHDGARPFLSTDFLARMQELAESYDSLIPVLPIVETLKEVDSSGLVKKTHDRNRFVRVQTPQIFRYGLILSAHHQLKDSPIEYTDDAMMIESLGLPVQICEGDPQNIKVTVLEDLRIKNIHA